MKILFSSDQHGNLAQFTKILDYASENKINAVIIGGDITPKGRSIALDQGYFLERQLLPLLKKYMDASKGEVFLMLGNDDWAVNYGFLRQNNGTSYRLIHNEAVPFNSFTILGYSFVPITPFGIKDWEKWDTKEKRPEEALRMMRLHGIKSDGHNLVPFSFDESNRNNCIENDMALLFSKAKGNTILVSHSPPYNTALDMLSDGSHVGSIAIREAIEKHSPVLSLHGHIHETVDVSGKFTDIIGSTICASSGNHNVGENVSALVVELGKIKIERITI